MAKGDIADKWLEANGHKGRWQSAKDARRKLAAKQASGQGIRLKRIAILDGTQSAVEWVKDAGLQTIRSFVEEHRAHMGADCLFVPGAMVGQPASVKFCGKNIAAARYMCLLTHGAPKVEGAVVRHKCGNGHLSCVNPAHVIWGMPGDNIGDANIHRAMDGATVEDKCRAVDARTSK